jgi:endonuclease G
LISQVYGGGGNSGATYQNDFVELYNRSASPVDTAGWSIQYTSEDGDSWDFGKQPLGGTIGPGEYYLIALGSGGAIGAPLPAAQINGLINMGSTGGKVALVNSFDGLVGNCPLGDPSLLDFVGYGSPDCREGAAPAPAPSSSTSIFRLGGGSIDTNNNGSDFVTGSPNPRQTAPIVELGPLVLGTDPRKNGTNAARDASINVTFTEPVDVVGSWFDITCPSGQHNDATFAVTDGSRTHVITPNLNFVAGEQCTVTIFKDQIHDQDTDDADANTDGLPANYVWTFTVATGTAPPYPSSVHLTMGDPGCGTIYGCAAASLGQPNNFLMDKPEFTISYNRDKGGPNWVSWHLTDEWIGSLTRVDTFRPDPGVPDSWYRVQAFDFSGSGFDRGHMTPNADRDKETSIPINQATFLMSNMVAQAPDNNQGPWAAFEGFLRTLLPGDEVYIVSGPFGVGGTGSAGPATTIANGHVTVPAQTWKVALVIPKASGDDISRVSCSSRTIAVIMPNIQGIRNNPWENYLTTVDAVEQLTGYNFFSNLPPAIQACVEAGTNGTNPPGTADQSASTAEDNAVVVTLQALQANNNALTFSIVNGPTSGSLGSVSAASCASGTCTATVTYTPGADFNGSDSFTFKASDGSVNSNTSMVSVGVSEVNDSPSASADSKTTQEDTQLSFAAGDLTGNDSAGPANEAAQSLTVTSVTGDVNTHGTLTLDSGIVTYTPAANFNGPASFTYSVCDNGTTNGSSDPKCAIGTVNVAVNAVNDAPDAVDDSATIAEDSGANLISVLGNDTDVENDTLTVSAVTQGAHGSVTNNGSSVSYTPAPNFFGTDSFTYTANDGHSGSDTATVNITVTNVNDAPELTSSVAVSLISSTNSNLVNVGLTASATDQEGEVVTIQVAVFGDEDDETATIPGVVHSPDAKDIAPSTLRLRGERVEANDGRVYLIVVTATDTSGGVSRNYHTVVVPKNNKPASVTSVNNQAAAAITYALSNAGAPPPGYFVIGDGPIIGPKQ